jgi:hypothetical protein
MTQSRAYQWVLNQLQTEDIQDLNIILYICTRESENIFPMIVPLMKYVMERRHVSLTDILLWRHSQPCSTILLALRKSPHKRHSAVSARTWKWRGECNSQRSTLVARRTCTSPRWVLKVFRSAHFHFFFISDQYDDRLSSFQTCRPFGQLFNKENFIDSKVLTSELKNTQQNLKNFAGYILIVHQVYNIFHSVIVHKLKDGPTAFFVLLLVDAKVQINKLRLRVRCV